MKINGFVVGIALVGVFLFVPYAVTSNQRSEVTGSFRRSVRWLVVIPYWHTSPSPLRLWCEAHQVVVQEGFHQQDRDSYTLLGARFEDGSMSAAASEFPYYFQVYYLKHEQESAIRAYVAAMMAAPNENARRELAKAAAKRAEELAAINHETLRRFGE